MNKEDVRIGKSYRYFFDDKENMSDSIVKVVGFSQDPRGVAEVEFEKIICDDSGNGYFSYLLETGKTMFVSIKYLHELPKEEPIEQDRLIDSKRLLENLEYLRKAHLTEADVSSQDEKAYYRGFHAALKLVTGMVEHIAGTSVVRCKDCCFFDKDKKRCDHPGLDFDVERFSHWINTEPDDFCSFENKSAPDMNFYNCLLLISDCIKADLLTVNPEDPNEIFVYCLAGDEDHPEGWYRENIHEAARELMEDKDGQSFLLSALKEKTGEDFEPHEFECPV